jgi:tripartite-type tricarboxylate transporter receptor subunit TctC
VTGTAADAAHAVARVQPHGTAILFGDLETNLKLRDAQAGLGLPGDFDSIGTIGLRRFGLYANAGAPAIRAAADLFDAINRNELGMLVHGDASSRLCATALSQLLRLPPERVVGFPGLAPAFAQVVGSGSSFICLPASPAVPSSLRLIAVSRPGFFRFPSMQSLGIEFTSAAAVGLFVRKDTPIAVRGPLENAVNAALENNGLRSWMRENFAMDVRQPGAGAAPASPAAAAASTERAPAPAAAAPAAAPTADALPSTRLTLNDATAECDCTRKLGRCSVRTSIRDTQTARLSNGLSSLVIVGIDPPPRQCVEVTVYLRERAVVGDRPRSTGHPLYRVIDGPTDVEWRNVGTPASELSYSITPSETECYLCKKKSVVEPVAAPAPGRDTGGPYFHASIMSPTQHMGTYPGGETYFNGSHLALGLSSTSAEDARRRACHWPNGAGGVSNEACVKETLTETFGNQPQFGGHTQQVLKCAGRKFFAVSLSAGAVGVACGAESRERAERGALEACRQGWARIGLPDGGGRPAVDTRYPAECYVAYSALNDGTFAPGDGFAGFRDGGNGLWFQCWGRDRRHFNPHVEQACTESIKYCKANPGECK